MLHLSGLLLGNLNIQLQHSVYVVNSKNNNFHKRDRLAQAMFNGLGV